MTNLQKLVTEEQKRFEEEFVCPNSGGFHPYSQSDKENKLHPDHIIKFFSASLQKAYETGRKEENDALWDKCSKLLQDKDKEISRSRKESRSQVLSEVEKIMKGMHVKENRNNFFKERSYNQALDDVFSKLKDLKSNG